MKIGTWFKLKFKGIKGEGSAFARVATHDLQLLEARGKIIALDAATSAAHSVLSALEKESARVHAERDEIDARFAKLSKSL